MLELQKELRALNMNVGCGGANGKEAETGGRVCAFQNVFEGQPGQTVQASRQKALRPATERSNNNSNYRKAKVLYAYEALAETELTVKQNEVRGCRLPMKFLPSGKIDRWSNGHPITDHAHMYVHCYNNFLSG